MDRLKYLSIVLPLNDESHNSFTGSRSRIDSEQKLSHLDPDPTLETPGFGVGELKYDVEDQP